MIMTMPIHYTMAGKTRPDPSPELEASHGFLMLGTKNLYLCHLPMYFMPAHAYQSIVESEIEDTAWENYLKIKRENPSKPLIVLNDERMSLERLVNSNSFSGLIFSANEDGDPVEEIGSTKVIIKKKLLFEQLFKESPDYPENLEYYLFGTNMDWHLSHFTSKWKNFEHELDISISGTNKVMENGITKISFPSVKEKSRQPISSDPLTDTGYTVTMQNGKEFEISITNRFWINNKPLNDDMS
jgi:hypothetical protein